MGSRVLGVMAILASLIASVAVQMQTIRRLRGHWIVLAVPPVLLIVGAVWGVVLLLRGKPDLALMILFLALPVATGWLVLIHYLRRD